MPRDAPKIKIDGTKYPNGGLKISARTHGKPNVSRNPFNISGEKSIPPIFKRSQRGYDLANKT